VLVGPTGPGEQTTLAALLPRAFSL
jgi:flagellar biosynthesis GTPase FlhF